MGSRGSLGTNLRDLGGGDGGRTCRLETAPCKRARHCLPPWTDLVTVPGEPGSLGTLLLLFPAVFWGVNRTKNATMTGPVTASYPAEVSAGDPLGQPSITPLMEPLDSRVDRLD